MISLLLTMLLACGDKENEDTASDEVADTAAELEDTGNEQSEEESEESEEPAE